MYVYKHMHIYIYICIAPDCLCVDRRYRVWREPAVALALASCALVVVREGDAMVVREGEVCTAPATGALLQ